MKCDYLKLNPEDFAKGYYKPQCEGEVKFYKVGWALKKDSDLPAVYCANCNKHMEEFRDSPICTILEISEDEYKTAKLLES